MLHPLPLPLSSCLGCIPPLIGLPSLRFYAVGSSLFLLSVCFCLCSLFYRDDVLCWLLLARPFLYAFHAHLRFPVDLVWFRLSCDHGWIRSGSVNVRKQQQNNNNPRGGVFCCSWRDGAGGGFPPRRDGAVFFFFRGGTGRLLFFSEAGRGGFFFFFRRDGTGRCVCVFFFEGRDGTVVFGGGNFFGGTGQIRYTVPPKAV